MCRDAAYGILCRLLRDSNLAVRLAACDALLKLVDDVSFFADSFDSHVVSAMEGFLGLLSTAREVWQILAGTLQYFYSTDNRLLKDQIVLAPFQLQRGILVSTKLQVDTKLRVLNVVSIVMEGVGEHIAPAVSGVVNAVPALWAEAQQQHLMKGAVLVTITRLVQALRSQVLFCWSQRGYSSKSIVFLTIRLMPYILPFVPQSCLATRASLLYLMFFHMQIKCGLGLAKIT